MNSYDDDLIFLQNIVCVLTKGAEISMFILGHQSQNTESGTSGKGYSDLKALSVIRKIFKSL